MDAAPQPSPEEIAALRAALALAEARSLQGEAELALARAMASDDKALIAHQSRRPAKPTFGSPSWSASSTANAPSARPS